MLILVGNVQILTARIPLIRRFFLSLILDRNFPIPRLHYISHSLIHNRYSGPPHNRMKIFQFCLEHIHPGLIIILGLKYLHSFHTDPELPNKLVKEDQFSGQIQSIRNRFVLDSGQKMKLKDYLGIILKNITFNPLFSSFLNPAWFSTRV